MNGSFAATRREAELKAGRDRLLARMESVKPEKRAEMEKRFTESDEKRKAELQRRNAGHEGLFEREIRHRAAVNIIGQAQNLQSAVIQDAFKKEPGGFTSERWREIERLENVDLEQAQEAATLLAVAQAVNQPAVLANERGETNDEGEELAPHPMRAPTPVPAEVHVPKTRKRAEELARGRVPNAKDVIRPGLIPDRVANPQLDEPRVANANAAVDATMKSPELTESLNTDITELLR